MIGLFDMIKLGSVLLLAIPAFLAGFEFLVVRGQPAYGIPLMVLSVTLVVMSHYLSMPTSLKSIVARQAVDHVVPDEDESEERNP